MAKIYNFELKGVKSINEDGFSANLYFNNKKIGSYIDNNDETLPTIKFEQKLSQENISQLLNEIKSFYEKNPKEMISNTDEYLIIEFVEELYRLRELETIFKKLNKKEHTSLIELRFSKRASYISDYQREDICLSTTRLDEEFETKLFEKYKPAEYTVYKSLDDFNINK